MIHFDPSEIANWADNPDGHYRLPELIRRLILATVPIPSFLDMPSGSSVFEPGWDGLLSVVDGSTWVPNGNSGWEFSCARKPKNKADQEYAKRLAEPQGLDVSQSTFIFVTARKWNSKRQWVESRRADNKWADVKVLNASDLVAWLQQAPAVSNWFARLIGKLPAEGVEPLDEWWKTWRSAANPIISPRLVLAGRHSCSESLWTWFQGQPHHQYVQGDTRDEAIAFIAASSESTIDHWGASLLSKAIVVRTPEAWRSLECHSLPLVLIRDFEGNVSPQVAVEKGHHVLTPLDRTGRTGGQDISLPRLSRDEALNALQEMGLSESKARSLVRKSATRLTIIRRFLMDDAGAPIPEWASAAPHSIAALTLVGQWDESSAGDKENLSRLLKKSYAEIENDVNDMARQPDAPLVKIGRRWRFVSHEEAWHLLAPKLTSSYVERFRELAVEVLGQVSPKFELPVAERYLTSIKGKVLPQSDTLREGIARSLALIGVSTDRAKYVENLEYLPAQVVRSCLGDGTGWQIWATLDENLATLAEAGPDTFLDAVERHLTDSDTFAELFNQESDGLFSGAPHTGLLWALERLAWSHDHFSRVARILAHLVALDPAKSYETGRVANRPARSLRDLFLPWARFSEASNGDRLNTLAELVPILPEEVWQLLVDLTSPDSRRFILREPPNWRSWGQDAVYYSTVQECRTFIGWIEKNLLSHAGEDAKRWADVVDLLPNLSLETREQVFEALSRQIETLKQHPASLELWSRIRKQLHSNRLRPSADWALRGSNVAELDDLYQRMTPTDPVKAYAWVFAHWPEMPNPVPIKRGQEVTDHDIHEQQKNLRDSQEAAVLDAYAKGGHDAILDLARATELPGNVGAAVAQVMETNLAISLAWPNLGSLNPKCRVFAGQILFSLFPTLGWDTIDEVLAKVKSGNMNTEAVVDVYLAARANVETWDRLIKEPQHTWESYWKSIPWYRIETKHDLPRIAVFAFERFLEAHRSSELVESWAFLRVPIDLVVRLLEQIPLDHSPRDDGIHHRAIDGFMIAHIFERLDDSADVSDDVIARLEIPYIPGLEEHRPALAAHRLVVKQPEVFADLVSWVFKRSDGQFEDGIDAELRERRAEVAWIILSHIRGLPGLMISDEVDSRVLSGWVQEVRRLCSVRDRKAIGDEQIGQVLANAPEGQDGIWPCEPVRDLLDRLWNQEIASGFTMGMYNLRGTTTRGIFEGGGQERTIADKYRADADVIASKWPFTASLLRQMADSYKFDGVMHDQSADWSQQFGY